MLKPRERFGLQITLIAGGLSLLSALMIFYEKDLDQRQTRGESEDAIELRVAQTEGPYQYLQVSESDVDMIAEQYDVDPIHLEAMLYARDNINTIDIYIPQENRSAIIESVDGRAICNMFAVAEYVEDFDDSTYPDNYELWLNEIAYLMRPSIDSPDNVNVEYGTLGEVLTWAPQSGRPQNYTITVDGEDGGSLSERQEMIRD